MRVAGPPAEVKLTLERVHGQLLLHGSDAAVWQINRQPVHVCPPAAAALVPGWYHVRATDGSWQLDQAVYVRPQARLRLSMSTP